MKKNWEKFSLLMWKNFALLRRQIAAIVLMLLHVVLILGFIIYLRIKAPPVSKAKVTYSSFALDQNASGFQVSGLDRIVWSPCNRAIDEIMTEVATIFHLQNNSQCYPNASNLRIYTQTHSHLVFAGFQFDDDYAHTEALHPNVHATFRYPSELRIPTNDSANDLFTWETQNLFPKLSISGPRYFEKEKGAPPEYFHETFLTFQYEISRQIIKYFIKDPNIELPSVVMQRYPYPDWIADPLLTIFEKTFPIIVLVIIMSLCAKTVEDIVTEKESQMKEIMKIMGLSNWLHWAAWFVRALIFGIILTGMIIVTMKVHWSASACILTKTNTLILIMFLLIYLCSCITLCFAVTVFFSKANVASLFTHMILFVTMTPYIMFIQRNYYQISMAEKVCSSFLSNTAMCLGFHLIIMFENIGEGFQWKYLFSTVFSDDRFTLGLIMIMLLIDTFLYLLIALYVEAVFPGDYGIPRVWYFPFTKNFWRGTKSLDTGPDDNTYVSQSSSAFENEPTNLRAVIVVKNLKKVYPNNTVAVQDFSINIYEDQITALLGHNGSGKTTLMSVLTGILPPTKGTAVINGYDIRTDINKIRKSLSFCPQHNTLFKVLTVKDHLYFFGKLKGLNNEEVKQEIIKYTEILGLVEKKDNQSQKLSGAMLRKLSVGIALCGKSEVVILDEPSAGVDPGTRRTIWELLQKEKKGRTILLSTHFMDEADVLGDRIAIMAAGQLKSCGSSFFLKKKFGTGYTLIIEKSERFDVNKMSNLIRSHVPNAEMKENVGSELSYVLPEEQTESFKELFADMEDNQASLGIKSFGISRTTLEEVFMKIGVVYSREEEYHLHNHDQNKKLSETKVSIYEKEFLRGCALHRNQFLAMMMKRIVYARRTWVWLLLQIVIPICLVVIFLATGRTNRSIQNLPKFDYNLNPYKSITTITTSDVNDPYYNAYKKLLQREGRDIKDWQTEDMSSKILKTTDENVFQVRMQYIIGATFEPNKITAWFNNEPYHSPPVALQYVMNSILQAKMGSQYSIQISLRPLPYDTETRMKITSSTATEQQFGLIGLCLSITTAFYVSFMTKERVSKFKHLQLVSGAELLTFWGCSFLWDFFTLTITSLCLSLALLAFQDDGFRTAEDFGRLILVLLCFDFAILPIMYLLSLAFPSPNAGFTVTILLNAFSGMYLFQIVSILKHALDLKSEANTLHCIFLMFPQYTICSALFNIKKISSIQKMCELTNELAKKAQENVNVDPSLSLHKKKVDYACVLKPDLCCDIQENYFALDIEALGYNMLAFICVGFAIIILLILTESEICNKIDLNLTRKQKEKEVVDDSDVLEEKRKIETGEIHFDKTNIVIKDLTKYYGSLLAVNQLYLGINEYECFGLLGVNGAGKTTVFKMLTGDIRMSSGDIWINGINLKKNLGKTRKYIGYCPQFDALLDELTGKEILIIFSLIRGIAWNDAEFIAEQLAKDFDFEEHLEKRVKQYSGGNKRKLSTALAFIGDPPIIFLDEPTSGMDPKARRTIWNVLSYHRDAGKCLVLTSHNMEECEALCTRLTIMVNGVLKCLGSTQHLKSKFSKAYILNIKLTKLEPTDDEIDLIEKFVRTNFPNATMTERYQQLLKFYIPDTTIPISKMFGIMERSKKAKELNIEDYSLGQSNLEQVYLSITKEQEQH